MTIWILALVLLGASAALGHKQGGIRAAISLVGIVISALLAWPLSGIIRAPLPHLGFHNPITVWLLPPLIVFVLALLAFKSAGFAVHRRVEVYYRYKRDELKFALWNRLNHWLGCCVGLINGLVYFVLLTVVIYDFSYWTTQVAISDNEKGTVKLLNRAGRDLDATRLSRVALAINPLPKLFFTTADLAGTIVQNPQLRDRLANYPPFISLAERDDFKQLGQDEDFLNDWKEHSLDQMMGDPAFHDLWSNQGTRDLIWNIVRTNFDDFSAYLQTGRSAKFAAEPIYGHWQVNVVATLLARMQGNQNVPSSDMAAMRMWWVPPYSNTVFTAGADGQAFLNNLPHLRVYSNPRPNQPPDFDFDSWQGRWNNNGNGYDVSLASGGATKSGSATLDGSRLTLSLNSEPLVLDREQ